MRRKAKFIMKECKKGGIYLLRNLSDGKVYIGKSINLEKNTVEYYINNYKYANTEVSQRSKEL